MEVVPSNKLGLIDVAALGDMLRAGGVKAVAITHVPTNGGVINPAKEGVSFECIEAVGCLAFLSLVGGQRNRGDCKHSRTKTPLGKRF